jgi:CheY-like chemotaxis protein
MSGADRPPGIWSVIEVEDHGTGMDEATLSRIFEPFFTTKDLGEGTGLGLSTVWWIVERCSGVIDVRTQPGSGTTIAVHLPFSAAVDQADSKETTSRGEGSTGRRMLLAEDDQFVQRALVEMLEIAGWFVVGVANAADALDALRDETTPFDVLVTDLSMPGMGGRELARQVRAEYPGLKIVLVSGSALSQHELDADSLQILAKPFTIEQLEATIATSQ